MSDSLTSGQPLIFSYSYSKRGTPLDALATLLATHATGSVRLQVTGRPPITRASERELEHPSAPNGSAAARPRSAALRETKRNGMILGLRCRIDNRGDRI